MEAHYYDGRSARRHDAQLAIVDGELRLNGEFGSRRAPLAEVAIGERFGAAPRSLRFADGAWCEPQDGPGFEAMLAAEGWREGAVVRLQNRWPWALAALGGFVGCVAAAYFVLLPWFAGFMAPRLPAAFATAVADQALGELDRNGMLQPSRLSAERQQAIAAQLAALKSGGLPAYRLHFRAAPRIGPNAFALPDGQVVLLDELVALAADDAQVVAVLAHELGHVQHRHGMRQMIQGAVVSFAAAAWFGDISSLAAGFGALVLESRYSREFEREADAWAARLLAANGGSAEVLAQVLLRLEEKARGKGKGGEGADWLASHPDVAERVAALRAAAGR